MKKNVKYRVVFIGLLLLTVASCSVESRFNRLVSKHPWLLESQKIDTTIIQKYEDKDTVFSFSKKNDTFNFLYTRIIKKDSKIFIYSKVPPCTTNITKTIIQPSKQFTQWKDKKDSPGINPWILSILSGMVIALIIARR